MKNTDNLRSMGGGDGEDSSDDGYHRGSERPRHKNRSVSLFDYVRLTLEAFPNVYKVAVACGVVGMLVLAAWAINVGFDAQFSGNGFIASTLSPTSTEASPTAPVSARSGTEGDLAPTPNPTKTMTPEPIDINFNADIYTIRRGECTTLHWVVRGAESIRLLGREVDTPGAEEVCPDKSKVYTLGAENQHEALEESFEIEVTEPNVGDRTVGCLGYDQNGQLVCKSVCGPNDPGGTCSLTP